MFSDRRSAASGSIRNGGGTHRTYFRDRPAVSEKRLGRFPPSLKDDIRRLPAFLRLLGLRRGQRFNSSLERRNRPGNKDRAALGILRLRPESDDRAADLTQTREPDFVLLGLGPRFQLYVGRTATSQRPQRQ